MSLDANNLYGWAMVQSLPFENLQVKNNIKKEEILNTDDDADVGYIVECNLKIPKEIHDDLREFPPCAENTCPKAEWMSDFQKELLNKNIIKLSRCPKLIPHLYEHKNYCIHYRNLIC